MKGRFGGGVCFYILSTINYVPCPDLYLDHLENLCIEIRKPQSRPFVITTWYRPPDFTIDKFNLFESLVGRLDAESVGFYIVGDLNCNLAANQLGNSSHHLTNITDTYNLHQLINEPTWVTETLSTMIDLIFTNCPDRVVCSGVSHIGTSDHSLAYVCRKISIESSNKGHSNVTYRKFKNFDTQNFCRDIRIQNWDTINLHEDPNNMWHAWKIIFSKFVDKHAPLRTKLVRAFNHLGSLRSWSWNNACTKELFWS